MPHEKKFLYINTFWHAPQAKNSHIFCDKNLILNVNNAYLKSHSQKYLRIKALISGAGEKTLVETLLGTTGQKKVNSNPEGVGGLITLKTAPTTYINIYI